MQIIPAIDLLDGKVVRLQKGSYDEVTVYNDNPLVEAQKFAEAGFGHIHIVDLNGARDGQFFNIDQIKQIKKETELSIQIGGGIRSYDDAAGLINTGIDQLVCSSMAVKNREDWMKLLLEYPKRMILGMDLKDGKIAYGGWLETADATIESFLKPMIGAGLKFVLSTDIARDGMLEGVNVELYQSLQEQYPELDFIASGGVASVEDFKQLQEAGLYGVVVGRAYYEQEISLEEMDRFNTGSTIS
jgi:phosphoribosylformimino-5-aminoimidazole carboxamide ribotide isomerase